jgi:asparagine synthase (glutamine-hydrolysing)
MCGIGGYYGTFEPTILSNFINKLRHRGPDDIGLWTNGNVGLMHTRLSIIDLSSAGHQPMLCNDLAITFNGEIYNYRELRKKLMEKGESFVSESDTEVILKMYKQYGVSCIEQLNGIFAFAIWDMTRQILLVARDHVGVKPFYYSFIDKGFLFASELKAILSSKEIISKIEPTAIISHVVYLWSPGSITMFSEIKKLEPGEAMIISNGKLEKKWKFYELPYN